jgi:threonine/homoserine/homoserine lactone efflux protein
MPIAGPIAILVFARSVDSRFRSALGIAAGGAIAEMVYAFLAYWGFAALLTRYPVVVIASRGAAAIVLTALGIVFLRRKAVGADPQSKPARREGWGGGFALGFTITALNPTLIVTWTAASATLLSTGLVEARPALALPFGIGAGAGIVGWFVVLVALVRRYRGRFRTATLNRVIRAMGVLLIGLGIWFAVMLFRGL